MPPAPPFAPNEAPRMAEPGGSLASEAPKLTLNIDSLEEEMARLLGRPMEPPKA
jgi:hypothetical protein